MQTGITKEYLLESFDYKPETGTLHWRVRRSNIIKIGEEVRHINSTGYKQVRLLGKLYLVHRLVWFLETGEWPKYLDHKNGDRLDNRVVNLREATSSQNNANREKKIGYTSKYKGVYWHKQRKKWHAQIQISGKQKSLGLHLTEELAALAYNEAALEYHGEFAKLNNLEETR